MNDSGTKRQRATYRHIVSNTLQLCKLEQLCSVSPRHLKFNQCRSPLVNTLYLRMIVIDQQCSVRCSMTCNFADIIIITQIYPNIIFVYCHLFYLIFAHKRLTTMKFTYLHINADSDKVFGYI